MGIGRVGRSNVGRRCLGRGRAVGWDGDLLDSWGGGRVGIGRARSGFGNK